MSSQGLPTLVLDLRPRRAERRCAFALVFLSALVPVCSRIAGPVLSLAIGLIAVAIVGAGFWFAGWLGGWRSLARLVWRPDGSWRLLLADGRKFEGHLQASSRMSPAAIWLRWNLEYPPAAIRGPEGRKAPRPRTLMLLPGDLPEADFRRLLVRLRLDQSECAPTTTQASS